jgi:hypothetical protein
MYTNAKQEQTFAHFYQLVNSRPFDRKLLPKIGTLV